jgi:hypothetical protein
LIPHRSMVRFGVVIFFWTGFTGYR